MGSLTFFERTLDRISNESYDCGAPYDLSVDTRRLQPDARISLYPNPASHQITVEIPEDIGTASVQVFNLQGRLLMTATPGRGNQQVDVGRLSAGVYLVAVIGESGLVGRRRLVIR